MVQPREELPASKTREKNSEIISDQELELQGLCRQRDCPIWRARRQHCEEGHPHIQTQEQGRDFQNDIIGMI